MLCFSLAWGGYENDIPLIDVASGTEREGLKGHRFWLRALSFSAEGRWLASGGDDGAAWLWDLKTRSGRVLFQDPEEHQLHSVSAVAFSPDGALVATGHWDGRVRLWEAVSGQQIADLPGHRAAVTALAFAADGRQFLSGSDDTTALVWDLSFLLLPAQLPCTAEQWKAAWSDLASAKAFRGQRTAYLYRLGADAAVQLLDEWLRQTLSPDHARGMDRVAQLLGDLGSGSFKVRDKAQKELENMGFPVLPALRRELQKSPPLEVVRRLEQLIRVIEKGAERERWRLRRVLQILENHGTPRCRAILERLAREGHEPDMVRDALQRFSGRGAKL
jgi:hypothetical protein